MYFIIQNWLHKAFSMKYLGHHYPLYIKFAADNCECEEAAGSPPYASRRQNTGGKLGNSIFWLACACAYDLYL